MPEHRRVSLAAAIVLLYAVSPVGAQGALKAISSPQGGKIVYGQVEGAASEAAAMGAALRAIHNQYGDRPNVGRTFRVHGTNSVAAFFTLVKRNQGNGQLAGMVLASTFAPGHIEAAMVSDDAARFSSNINPMLNQLFGVWHPGGPPGSPPQSNPAPNAPTGGTAALRPYTLPDNSASVSLPDGWKVLPSSGGGTISAEGPNGEAVALDFPLGAMNSSDPRVIKTMQWVQQGGGRNTMYAKALYYPYGGDLSKAFVDLVQMSRARQGQPRGTFQIATQTPLQGTGNQRCVRLTGQMDAPEDGKGMRELNTIFCQGPLAPATGGYTNLLYHTVVPVQFAAKERATMGAILESFSVNMAVVQAEARAYAAPAIAAIHEVGRRAAQQAADAHEANDRYNRGVEARWDSRDKGFQAFSNYLLDQSVIRDNENNAHATVWNQTAERLVHDFPDRFEYVNTPDFWKYVDY